MSKVAVHVGIRIRQIRIQKNISLLSLSYSCDIQYSHLSKIEFGKINTSLDHLLKIADALDVCLICFFTNKNLDVIKVMNSEMIDHQAFSEIHYMKREMLS